MADVVNVASEFGFTLTYYQILHRDIMDEALDLSLPRHAREGVEGVQLHADGPTTSRRRPTSTTTAGHASTMTTASDGGEYCATIPSMPSQ